MVPNDFDPPSKTAFPTIWFDLVSYGTTDSGLVDCSYPASQNLISTVILVSRLDLDRVRLCSGLISPIVTASSDLVSHNLRIGVKEWGAAALDEFLSSDFSLASSVLLKIIQFACPLYLQVHCGNIGS